MTKSTRQQHKQPISLGKIFHITGSGLLLKYLVYGDIALQQGTLVESISSVKKRALGSEALHLTYLNP